MTEQNVNQSFNWSKSNTKAFIFYWSKCVVETWLFKVHISVLLQVIVIATRTCLKAVLTSDGHVDVRCLRNCSHFFFKFEHQPSLRNWCPWCLAFRWWCTSSQNDKVASDCTKPWSFSPHCVEQLSLPSKVNQLTHKAKQNNSYRSPVCSSFLFFEKKNSLPSKIRRF